ncbi:MAG: DUF4340 domain-containing protein [Candidatus Binataceae bacterium]
MILLALVGGYIYFFQAGKPEEETVKLFKIDPGDITRITLKSPGQEIEVERSGDKWKLVKPIQADADSSAITTLAHEIADCDIKRTVDEHPTDLAQFGLAKPAVTVVASTKDKTLPGVEVGKNSPIGYSVYIKTTDKPAVMLTSGAFGPGTKRTLSDLRDHTLMSFKVDDVNKLVVKQDDSTPVELQKDQGKWKIVKPAAYEADQERVRTMLSSLSNARVDDFASDNPSNPTQYGLDKPQLQVSVFTGPAQSQQSLEFGKKEPGQGKDAYYVRRGERPNVYTVHNYLFADADKGLNDLRDRTVFGFDSDKVGQVKVTNAGKTFVVTRGANGKWTEADGTKADADPVKVDQFLDRMRDLKAESIAQDSSADLGKYALNTPNEEVTFLGKDGKVMGIVKLAKIERRNEGAKGQPPAVQRVDYYALSSTSPTVYKIFEYDYTDLIKNPDQFAAPAPTAQPSPKK